jgi:hypothetical protein
MRRAQSSWVHLFTSNIRPVYEHDVVDVLAAPRGMTIRFRYAQRYVATSLHDLWRDDKLAKRAVLVHFSMQQEARYHDAAYIPLRAGMVVRTAVEGSSFVIYFTVGDYVSLADPTLRETDLGQSVRNFTTGLASLLGDGHPDKQISASEGGSAENLLSSTATQADAFEHAVGYLRRTRSFHDYAFARLDRLERSKTGAPVKMEEGVYKLTGGESYEAVMVHYQGNDALGVCSLRLKTDGELLRVVGSDEIRIASRYDTVPIRLFAPARDDIQHATIAIAPTEGLRGPTLQVPVQVAPSARGTVLYAGGTFLALAIAASPGAFGVSSDWAKVLLVGGALLGGAVTFFRRRRGYR